MMHSASYSSTIRFISRSLKKGTSRIELELVRVEGSIGRRQTTAFSSSRLYRRVSWGAGSLLNQVISCIRQNGRTN